MRLSRLIMMLMLFGVLAGCAKQPSTSRYKGKVKRGKPVPCPVKDC